MELEGEGEEKNPEPSGPEYLGGEEYCIAMHACI